MKTTITLDIKKSVHENANAYFEKAKKAKRKLESLLEHEKRMEKKALKEEKTQPKLIKKVERKRHWYEKFRWCRLSNGMLAIGGRDATTNEIVVKKHAEEGDLVFHTDMSGSPFVVVKADGAEISKEVAMEAAQLCGCFSRAWQRGFSAIEVFSCTPDQLSKTPESGEYIGKGAFIVRGKVTHYNPELALTVGIVDDAPMVGPHISVSAHASSVVKITQGDLKLSDAARQIAKRFEYTDLDAVVRALPTGGIKIEKD